MTTPGPASTSFSRVKVSDKMCFSVSFTEIYFAMKNVCIVQTFESELQPYFSHLGLVLAAERVFFSLHKVRLYCKVYCVYTEQWTVNSAHLGLYSVCTVNSAHLGLAGSQWSRERNHVFSKATSFLISPCSLWVWLAQFSRNIHWTFLISQDLTFVWTQF